MKFLFGLIIGVILLPVLTYFYILRGYAPVATAAPPFPIERKLAHMALNARIAKEAPSQPGVSGDETNLMAGAKLYREHCAVCHGMPNEPKTATAKGMFPDPPQLFEKHGVTDDPVGETYWKVANGIRLSGMPAYRESLTEQQMWQVSQLLATADKMPAPVKEYLAQPSPTK